MRPAAASLPDRYLRQVAVLLAVSTGLLLYAAGLPEPLHWLAMALIALNMAAIFLLARRFARALRRDMTRAAQRHEELLQSIGGIVWEVDAETQRLVFISDQVESMLGLPVANCLQPGFWIGRIDPEDRPMVVSTLATCAAERIPAEIEYRFRAADGQVRWIHDRIKVVAEPGRSVVLRGLTTDVTLRRQQENQTQRVLVEKESILNNALVGIVHLKNRRIVTCNRRFEEIFGYDPGELIGQSTEIFHGSHEAFVKIGEEARSALAEGRSFTAELPLRRKNGQDFWGAINGRAIDSAQPTEGSIWIYADVSVRRQAEEEAHKLLRAVEQSPISIVITDRNGLIEYVNPRFTTVSGYALDEAIGRNPSFLKSGVTPVETYADLWRTLHDGREWHGVLCNRRKDGELFWEEVAISPILNEKREITHFLAVKEDISERKRAEDALRDTHDAYIHLLSTTPDGFWLVDAEGYLLDVNATYIRQSGYAHEELLGMRVANLEIGDADILPEARMRRTRAKGSDQFETIHRRKDGSTWHVEVSASYRETSGGQYFVFIRDITARKRIQRQLEEHQNHLEDLVRRRTADLAAALEAAKVADRAKDAFLANISHELRTPLNAVIGLADLTERSSRDPKQRDTLRKISASGRTLLEIINDLLDLSKIAAGEMRFESIPFSLHQVVDRVVAMMTPPATQKNLRLEQFIDDDFPEVVVGDPLRIEQILFNLVSNAIKFTNEGKVIVRVTATADGLERIRLAIAVADSGIGLSEEAISRLFLPFAQADASITRKHGGTGLGLAMCKRLAEGMNGSISVDSRPGHGSCFRVTLLLGLGKAGDLPKPEAPADGRGSPARYPQARVLVVDDQPLNREVVSELLATVGIIPRMACDGQEALDVLASGGPGAIDLVLMDIQMPVMDGLTATQRIRTMPGFAELPIVAMTAHAMVHQKAEFLAAGMNDHIGKPFDLPSFFQLLPRWLDDPATLAAATDDPPPATAATPAPPPAAAGDPAGLEGIAGLDCGPAIERFAGNTARYRHWLNVFVDEAPGVLSQIGDQLAAGRFDDASKAAHALKGRAGMLGMTGLHGLASALEQATRVGKPTAEVFRPLEQGVEKMCRDLRPVIGHGAVLPPLQGEGRGGDGVKTRDRQPHPPPDLPREGGGTARKDAA